MTFYDEWLRAGEEVDAAFKRSPGVSRDAEREWVATRQDARAKLMLAEELGFPTMGGAVLKAEIPVGSHTGAHRHGEEAIHIVRGNGFAVIDGHRFDVRTGSTLHVPYRSAHQLVNTGEEPLLYVAANTLPLERFVNLSRVEQLEDHGDNGAELLAMPAEDSPRLPSGRRVVIHLDEAPTYADMDAESMPAAYRDQHGDVHYLIVEQNGFRFPTSVAMTHIFEEPAGHRAGRHKHLEAVLYVLDGEGFSDVDGAKEWSAGDVLHIPPAMYEHEHHNLSDRPCRLLRIQFGIRYWFTDLWPEGYRPQRVYDAEGRPIVSGRIDGGAAPARPSTG